MIRVSVFRRKSIKLASFGEIIWDVFGTQRKIGGAPLNIAAHAALFGFESYLISAVGDDELGKEALGIISDLGVKSDFICVKASLPTGCCNVTLGDGGAPSYNIAEHVAYDEIDSPKSHPSSFDVICFGTLALRTSHNMNTLKSILAETSFNEVYADLNIRAPFYSAEAVAFCLKNATIVKISDEEMPTVAELMGIEHRSCEASVSKLSDLFPNVRFFVITLGSDGSFCLETSGNKMYHSEAVKVDVVSTVGAGDSFGAAFLAAYIGAGDVKRALSVASHVSAYVVSSLEAIPDGSGQIFAENF